MTIEVQQPAAVGGSMRLVLEGTLRRLVAVDARIDALGVANDAWIAALAPLLLGRTRGLEAFVACDGS
jgi:hypothetical protein